MADWKPFSALVVGDLMLDEMVYGNAERLSADAPVPVLRVEREEATPGGAANLIMNLVALGGQVTVAGTVGADVSAGRLREVMTELASSLPGAGTLDLSALVEDPQRPTTVKRNLIGLAQHRHAQKMFRVDYESREPLGPEARARLLDAARAAIEQVDVVFIEDYAKGVCSQDVCSAVIEAARRAGKPVLVDPAAIRDYSKYTGASAITPNRTEAELASGLEGGAQPAGEQNVAIAHALLSRLDLDAVIVTLDRHGALLVERGGAPQHIPTAPREVYDVSGAGDMMIGALGAGLANGLGWADAVRLANAAAGLEVEVFGARPIPIGQVHLEVLRLAGRLSGKTRTVQQARAHADAVRGRGGKVVFTNGCFDILHAGHVSLLAEARALGDTLIVGLNSDASVRRLKGEGRPVHDEARRATVLGALSDVDAVVLFEQDTPIELIKAIRPDVLVKGADYTPETVVGADLLKAWGGRVALVQLVEGASTTGAIERIRGG